MIPMRHRQPSVLVWCLAASLVLAPSSGRASSVAGATEFTQIANNVQLVLQYSQQIIDYSMQIQHANELSRMTALFRDPRNAPLILALFSNLVSGLNRLVFAGGSLAEQWRLTHPGEKEPEAAGYRSIEEAYKAIDKDINRAAGQALKALDVYAGPENVHNEEAILQGLQEQMKSAGGQARLAQVANELLFEIIRQLSVIRQVLMVQARMTAEDVSASSQQRLYSREKKARDYQYHGRYRAVEVFP